MANYSIKDLEKFTGIKAHTLRIWEKRYNIVEPKRTSTNIRYYNDEDLKKLLNISILNKQGYKISNIANLNDSDLNEKIINISQNPSDTDTQIENLVVSMIELNENRFEKVLSTAIINLGFEETVLRIIYPFFEKIGLLWQIGTINPAQEHFISNLIRQKLIVAIDGIIGNSNDDPKQFMLFLPEGEFHEIGLLFYYYIIKKAGHKVVYLGESVPLNDMLQVAEIRAPDYLLTSITNVLIDGDLQEYLDELAENFKDQTIFIGGLQLKDNKLKLHANIKVVQKVTSFKEELKKL